MNTTPKRKYVKSGKFTNEMKNAPKRKYTKRVLGDVVSVKTPATVVKPSAIKKVKHSVRVRHAAPEIKTSVNVQPHRELYKLKGLMIAVTDFIHGNLGSEELLTLLKENGYEV
jgi:hypothetical protein